METLKVKFELYSLKFEIEGKEQIVRDEFKEFKEFTQQLLAKINLSNVKETLDSPEQKTPLLEEDEAETINEYPLLKDLVMHDLPKSEIEWMLIYAFYESQFGEKSFTKESVTAKYKETG